MKRLDLSCLPLNLEVGEIMELIDKKGKYHLLKCVMPDKKNSCKGCFFTKTAIPFNCDSVMCLERERGVNNGEVIYIELPVENEFKQDEDNEMKTLTFETISETGKIKAGETFIYKDGFNKKHKVQAKPLGLLNGEEACKRCAFSVFNMSLCLHVSCVRWDRESNDYVYFEELT